MARLPSNAAHRRLQTGLVERLAPLEGVREVAEDCLARLIGCVAELGPADRTEDRFVPLLELDREEGVAAASPESVRDRAPVGRDGLAVGEEHAQGAAG